MQAQPGDQVVIKGHRLGQPDRTGEVLEARGPDGTSPFLVRWDENGHVTLLFASSDCEVRHLHGTAAVGSSGTTMGGVS